MMSDPQWSDEQVLEALQAGVTADAQPEQAPEAPAPVGETQQVTPTEVQPVEPVAPATQNTEGLFDGTPINPDELIQQHPELAPLVKQLEGAFTQKTQGVAEQRKQFEALGPLEEVQQAIEMYNRITDPANWQQLHAELSQAMQQYGMTPAEAAQAATDAMTGAQPQTPPAEAASLDELDDPELAPLVQMIKAQQQELDALKNAREEERAVAQAEYERQAFLGELQRQENAIRAAHPDWDDEKILSVYQMSSFFNGDLSQAATRLESILANERALYLAQKESVAAATGTQVPPRGAGSVSEVISEPQTIRDAEAEAAEFFKARIAHYEGA